MNYANSKNIPFVILVGENEIEQGIFTIKNMNDGSQTTVNREGLISMLMNN